MKIAMMVRAFMASPVPNDIAYSPTGVAVAIAEGLAAQGHEITFFGPEGTKLNGVDVITNAVRPLATTAQQLYELITVTDLFQDYIPSLYDQYMVCLNGRRPVSLTCFSFTIPSRRLVLLNSILKYP